MLITNRTKLKDVLPLVNGGNIERLLELMPQDESFSLFSMSIKEFSEILDNEEDWIMTNIFGKERYAIKAFGKLKALKAQMEQLSSFLNKYNIPQSADEKNARQGITFPSFIQSILCDLVEFFHLSSFEEAEKYSLAEWLTIFQQKAATNLFQYRYQKAQEAKNKARSKRKK